MTEPAAIVYTVEPMDTLSISILVLFFGMYLSQRFKFLRDNYIPPAVSGGLVFSTLTALAFWIFDFELDFDLRYRDLLLLVFFSTVGLSAKFRALVSGGKALAIMIGVSLVFLICQNTASVGLATLMGYQPGYGLMGGSVSFAGGHGTAIAWGADAEAAGLQSATLIGVIFATFGLISGGVLGGPVARHLMGKYSLVGEARTRRKMRWSKKIIEDEDEDEQDEDTASRLFHLLMTLLVLSVCVSFGGLVNRFLSDQGLLFPGFLTSMAVAVLITNAVDVMGKQLNEDVIEGFGEVSLNVFLSMSMMSIQLWLIGGNLLAVGVVLVAQISIMYVFATKIVFMAMGKDYDAAVIAAGFTGMGLGATPVAIANMDAVTTRFGPSLKAFLVIPLIGAFFIDILNAAVIKGFIGVISGWLQ
jgi:ESS family glutamate:Na+ symporter